MLLFACSAIYSGGHYDYLEDSIMKEIAIKNETHTVDNKLDRRGKYIQIESIIELAEKGANIAKELKCLNGFRKIKNV